MSGIALRYIPVPSGRSAVFETLEWLDRSLKQAGLAPARGSQSRLLHFGGRVCKKLNLNRRLIRHPRTAYFTSISWSSDTRAFPYCFFNEIIPYALDIWPGGFDPMRRLLGRHRVRVAFFSARHVAEHFGQMLPDTHCYWLPEATQPDLYDPSRPLADRSTDVIEYGRTIPGFTDKLEKPLSDQGYRYFTTKGKHWLIPTNEALRAAIGDAKISVCYPASMTSPQSAGSVETVTLRYFEAIASRTLPVGHAPAELIDLFGFNPVIELSPQDPAPQLTAILGDITRYQPLVDRSLQRLMEVGTWDARAKQALAILNEHGYTHRV